MPATALVCLDDPALSIAVTARFHQLGWRVVVGDFLHHAVRCVPDLVLLDARADYLLKALKRDPRTSRLTVVAIGGYGDFDRRAQCLSDGALAFLTRPIDLEAFDTLTCFIEHGRSGAAEATPTSPPPRPAPGARV